MAEPEKYATRDEVADRLAQVIADAMQMSRPKRLEHEAAAGVLRALAGEVPLPPGLDARPVLRWTIHCSECGEPYREPEYEQVATWPTDCLPILGDFALGEQNWAVNEFEGRPLVCPSCECVGWCEGCGEEIRRWEPWHTDNDGLNWHRSCSTEGGGRRG